MRSRSPLLVALFAVLMACRSNQSVAKIEPAVASKEGDLVLLTLTEAADKRIVTGKPQASTARRTRAVTGEVIPASGRSLIVAAPVAGRIASASQAGVRPGQHVKRGDPLFRLIPVASVDRDLRAQASRNVSSAEARLTALDARYKRTEKLLAEGGVSERQLEEARAELEVAKAEVEATRRRTGILERAPLEADVAVTLRAPEDGVVRAMPAGTDGMVAAGAPLLEIVGTSALWVRATLFVGERSRIRSDVAARVRPLLGGTSEQSVEASPVPGPPTADPTTSSFDLYYSLPKESRFAPGERVAVDAPYGSDDPVTIVPTSAVVRDAYGGAWVYVLVRERTYERRRVEVDHVIGANAALTRGPDQDSSIVTTGASQLFGFEFTGK